MKLAILLTLSVLQILLLGNSAQSTELQCNDFNLQAQQTAFRKILSPTWKNFLYSESASSESQAALISKIIEFSRTQDPNNKGLIKCIIDSDPMKTLFTLIAQDQAQVLGFLINQYFLTADFRERANPTIFGHTALYEAVRQGSPQVEALFLQHLSAVQINAVVCTSSKQAQTAYDISDDGLINVMSDGHNPGPLALAGGMSFEKLRELTHIQGNPCLITSPN